MTSLNFEKTFGLGVNCVDKNQSLSIDKTKMLKPKSDMFGLRAI